VRRGRRSFGWFEASPKKPPPTHGIKVRSVGTTWWGERWIRALEEILRGGAARLARGRTYARAGRVHDLEIKAGQVTASVTGSRPEPYAVRIAIAELSGAAWKRAIAAMADKAAFSAALLAGEMPKDIEEAFRGAGARLFPVEHRDLATNCSCPDWGDPCKHVAAVHYVLGEAFDRDPFLLFELRGRTRDAVLDALRAARVGEAARSVEPALRKASSRGTSATSPRGRKATDSASEAPTTPSIVGKAPDSVRFERVSAHDYDRVRAPLPALHLTFDPPAKSAAVLRQLGTPASWTGTSAPADALAPLLRAAAESARQIALAESATADPDPTREPGASRATPGAKPARTNARGTTSSTRRR
jgi:uncharacterized Zn finger protein